jgi:hypothetical protein
MQLNHADKQKFLEYLEKKKLEFKENKMLESKFEENMNLEKLLTYMVEDLAKKSKRYGSKLIFEDYIFIHAMTNYQSCLSNQEKSYLEQNINENNYFDLLIESLLKIDNAKKYLGGLVFGYAKLAHKLKVEPESAFLDTVDLVNIISN